MSLNRHQTSLPGESTHCYCIALHICKNVHLQQKTPLMFMRTFGFTMVHSCCSLMHDVSKQQAAAVIADHRCELWVPVWCVSQVQHPTLNRCLHSVKVNQCVHNTTVHHFLHSMQPAHAFVCKETQLASCCKADMCCSYLSVSHQCCNAYIDMTVVCDMAGMGGNRSAVSNDELQQLREKLQQHNGGTIPQNFVPTAPGHDPSAPNPQGRMPRQSPRNPQTEQFLDMLGLPYNLDRQAPSAVASSESAINCV